MLYTVIIGFVFNILAVGNSVKYVLPPSQRGGRSLSLGH